MKKKPKNVMERDTLLTIDYGGNLRRQLLFLGRDKKYIMDWLAKNGLGESASSLVFSEVAQKDGAYELPWIREDALD